MVGRKCNALIKEFGELKFSENSVGIGVYCTLFSLEQMHPDIVLA